MDDRIENRIGNGQTIGQRQVQSNYFAVKEQEHATLAILADGGIDSINGRRAAILAVERMMVRLEGKMEEDPQQVLEQVICDCAKIIEDSIYLGKKPRVSLLVFILEKDFIYWKIVGDEQLFAVARGDIFSIKQRQGKRKRGDQRLMILCSAGMAESISQMELLEISEGSTNLYDNAQEMIELVNKKNYNSQKNATVILIHCS